MATRDAANSADRVAVLSAISEYVHTQLASFSSGWWYVKAEVAV